MRGDARDVPTDPFEGWLDRFDWILILFTCLWIPLFEYYHLPLWLWCVGFLYPAFLLRLAKKWIWKRDILILNLGCGEESYGDLRADITRSKTTNILCDAHWLPFQDATFSVVYSANLLEHLHSVGLSLLDQYRVMKPKGKLSLVTDNASYWRFHLPSKSAHINYEGRSENDIHYMLFMPFHLENLLELAGFTEIRVQFHAPEKPYRITGVINAFLRRLKKAEHLGYGRIKAEGVKP